MKGAQIATLVWLGNLLVLAGGAFIGYRYYSDVESARDSAFRRELRPRVPEVKWQEKTASQAAATTLSMNQALSPKARPRPDAPVDRTPPPPPPPELSDEELRAKLEAWVNKEFKLLYTLGSAAVLQRGAMRLSVYPGMSFKEEFKETPELAQMNLSVVSIYHDRSFNPSDRNARPRDHVVVRGPAILAEQKPQYADKFFEVALRLADEAAKPVDLSKLGSGTTVEAVRTPPPATRVEGRGEQVTRQDSRPMDSSYDSATDTWTLGRNDYDNADLANQLAQYAKVVTDREGNAVGIQIDERIPQDSVVTQRGGRAGDIIKAINGQPVRSMAEVRTVVRQQYNAGQDRFEVSYERDGVPGTKVFIVPRN